MNNDGATAGCLGILLWIAIGLTIGSRCFDYCLSSIFGKDIPWYADCIAGAVAGNFCIPVTVICWVVRLCGVEAPFVG